MKSFSILIFAASLFCFASCSQDKPVSDTTTETTVTTESATPAAQQPASTAPAMDNSMPAAAPNTQPQQQTAAPADVKAGMNPAHGQPNHRCDIAVGAPLNSPPAQQPQSVKVP